MHTYYTSADGIEAESTSGNVTASSNTVVTDGDFADGIFASTYSGAVAEITSAVVETTGADSGGVRGQSTLGDVSIASTYVEHPGRQFTRHRRIEFLPPMWASPAIWSSPSGDHSDGVAGLSLIGDVTIASTDVFTYGNHSAGVYGYTRSGNVAIEGTLAVTHGAYADAIYAFANGSGTIAIASGAAVTFGDYSAAVAGNSSGGTVAAVSAYAHTYGNHAAGIDVYGSAGVSVDNTGLVKTQGAHSYGIYAIANTGDAVVHSDMVVTYGAYADGIAAASHDGNVSVVSTLVKTYGEGSAGIDTGYQFRRRHGGQHHGLHRRRLRPGQIGFAYHGDVDIDSHMVVTKGYGSARASSPTITPRAAYGDVAGGQRLCDNLRRLRHRCVRLADVSGNVYVITNHDLVETQGYRADAIYGETAVSGDVDTKVVNEGDAIRPRRRRSAR